MHTFVHTYITGCWTVGSAVKSPYCYYREPSPDSVSTSYRSQSPVTNSRGSDTLFSPPWAPARTCTYPYTDTHPHA